MSESPRSQPATAFLPLKADVFLILLTLGEGERHGYGIMQDVAERTGGSVRLQPGALYRVLKRLLEDGLIVELERRPARAGADERRRYYRLSSLGRRVTRAEADRMAGLVRSARGSGLFKGAKPA